MDYNDGMNYAAIIAGLGAFLFVLVAISLVFYLLQAYGVYKMAQKRGIPNAGLAFVPIVQCLTIGALLGETELFGKRFKAGLALLIGAIAVTFLSSVPVLGIILDIAFFVLYYIILYRIYLLYKSESAVLYTILSVIFSGIATPIIFFSLRNTEIYAATFNEYTEKNPFEN
ncbi:hypothetical protein AGMMS49975_25820 [Clostridia bacterium]|nr:hypothetical protein AGMMS49975_25820 [Clostridia bacterium]